VNTFDDGGPLHQIIAFVTDHAGSAGNDLQISIIVIVTSSASFTFSVQH